MKFEIGSNYFSRAVLASHKFDEMQTVQMSITSLEAQTCMLLHASAGSIMKNKTDADVRDLTDNMDLNEGVMYII